MLPMPMSPSGKEFYMINDGVANGQLYNNTDKPPPVPQAGFGYVWEYAGYRNKDGTITPAPTMMSMPVAAAPAAASASGSAPPENTEAPAEEEGQLMSAEDCQRFGVPMGSRWKGASAPVGSIPAGGAAGQQMLLPSNEALHASFAANAAATPMMYGGYMPQASFVSGTAKQPEAAHQ